MKYYCVIDGTVFTDSLFSTAYEKALTHARTRHPKVKPNTIIKMYEV